MCVYACACVRVCIQKNPRGRHFSDVWETRDESDNFAQKHDVSLAKDKIRPSVVEEIRKQVGR